MNRTTRWFVAGAAVVVIAVVGIAVKTHVGKPAAPKKKTEGAALSVSIVHPQPMQWPRIITASGNIAPWQEAIVSAQLGGSPISDVLVDVGDEVKKGQLLAKFDETSVKAALNQYQAQVAEAQARLIDAKSAAQRANKLRKSGNISEQDLIAAQTSANAAEAQLKAANARLESEKLMLGYTRVVAPDDGVISSRSATLGKVTAVGTELFRLVRQNRLEWRPELTAEQIVQVEPGMHAEIRLPDGQSVSGTVRKLSPTLTDTTRTGIAYVDLDDPGSAARAGMFASGSINLGTKPGLSLPATALVMRDGKDYVFVLGSDKHISLKTVTTGRRNGEEVEILAGVSQDQPIVKRGGAFLNDGDQVHVVDQAQANSGASS